MRMWNLSTTLSLTQSQPLPLKTNIDGIYDIADDLVDVDGLVGGGVDGALATAAYSEQDLNQLDINPVYRLVLQMERRRLKKQAEILDQTKMRSHARLEDAMRKQKLDQLRRQLNQLETISLDETVRSGRRITMLTQKKRLLEAEAVLRKLNTEYDSRRESKAMDSLRGDGTGKGREREYGGGGGGGGGNRRERSREKSSARDSERDEAISLPQTDLSIYEDDMEEQHDNEVWPSEMTMESLTLLESKAKSVSKGSNLLIA